MPIIYAALHSEQRVFEDSVFSKFPFAISRQINAAKGGASLARGFVYRLDVGGINLLTRILYMYIESFTHNCFLVASEAEKLKIYIKMNTAAFFFARVVIISMLLNVFVMPPDFLWAILFGVVFFNAMLSLFDWSNYLFYRYYLLRCEIEVWD